MHGPTLNTSSPCIVTAGAVLWGGRAQVVRGRPRACSLRAVWWNITGSARDESDATDSGVTGADVRSAGDAARAAGVTRRASPGPEEFEAFATARWAALCRYGFLLTGDRSEAQDLVQTALAKTFASLKRLRDPGDLEGYVRRVMVNSHISLWRRHRGREHLGAAPDADSLEAAQAFERVVAGAELWPLLAALPRRQRVTLVLRYFEDLTEAQVAGVMGCSVGTVKSQTHRALETLRTAMTRDETSYSGEGDR